MEEDAPPAEKITTLRNLSKVELKYLPDSGFVLYGNVGAEIRAEVSRLLPNREVIHRVYLRHGSYRIGWIVDNEVIKCMICNDLFTLLSRRHHCRNCGIVICGSCSNHRAIIKQLMSSKPGIFISNDSRVCDLCCSKHRLNEIWNAQPPPPAPKSPAPVIEAESAIGLEIDPSLSTPLPDQPLVEPSSAYSEPIPVNLSFIMNSEVETPVLPPIATNLSIDDDDNTSEPRSPIPSTDISDDHNTTATTPTSTLPSPQVPFTMRRKSVTTVYVAGAPPPLDEGDEDNHSVSINTEGEHKQPTERRASWIPSFGLDSHASGGVEGEAEDGSGGIDSDTNSDAEGNGSASGSSVRSSEKGSERNSLKRPTSRRMRGSKSRRKRAAGLSSASYDDSASEASYSYTASIDLPNSPLSSSSFSRSYLNAEDISPANHKMKFPAPGPAPTSQTYVPITKKVLEARQEEIEKEKIRLQLLYDASLTPFDEEQKDAAEGGETSLSSTPLTSNSPSPAQKAGRRSSLDWLFGKKVTTDEAKDKSMAEGILSKVTLNRRATMEPTAGVRGSPPVKSNSLKSIFREAP
jgi:hypothetical protein